MLWVDDDKTQLPNYVKTFMTNICQSHFLPAKYMDVIHIAYSYPGFLEQTSQLAFTERDHMLIHTPG